MYAIVNIAGQQFKVQENTPVFIHRLEANEGDSVNFDEVLLVDDNGSIKVGAPLIAGASVSAKVLSHLASVVLGTDANHIARDLVLKFSVVKELSQETSSFVNAEQSIILVQT